MGVPSLRSVQSPYVRIEKREHKNIDENYATVNEYRCLRSPDAGDDSGLEVTDRRQPPECRVNSHNPSAVLIIDDRLNKCIRQGAVQRRRCPEGEDQEHADPEVRSQRKSDFKDREQRHEDQYEFSPLSQAGERCNGENACQGSLLHPRCKGGRGPDFLRCTRRG